MKSLNIEELKEIQSNIEMTPPFYSDIIDEDELKEQIWHYRMSNNTDRKEAFLKLVKTKIDSGLFTWEKSFKQNDQYITRIESNETDLNDKEKRLKLESNQKKKHFKVLDKEYNKAKDKLKALEEKIIDYSDKFKKNNSMKKITLVMMMVFSLLMATGTAILLNKIGTKTAEMQSVLSGDNTLNATLNINEPVSSEDEDDGYGEDDVSTQETIVKNEEIIQLDKGKKKTDWGQTFMFFLYSLIFLALGKVVSIAYEELNHPKWLLFILIIGVISVTIPLVLVTVEQLKNQVTFKEDNAQYIKMKAECAEMDTSAYNENFECVGWNNRKMDILKLENMLKEQLEAVKRADDGADDYYVQSEGGKESILSFKKQYDDLERRLYSETTKNLGIQKILMFFAEMLFSSLAWVYFVRTFTGEKMLAKLSFRKKELKKDLVTLKEKEVNLKNEISNIDGKILEVDKLLKEVINLKSKLLNKEEIKEKVKLIKEEYLHDSLITLQEIEAWIMGKIAQESK